MRTFTTHCLALACTLAACGDDGPGPVDSGLPAEKSGKDLTEAERETFCEAAAENLAAQNTKAEQCVLVGLTAAAVIGGTAEDCQLIAKMCRDGKDEQSGGDEPMCSYDAALPTCDAPIADIEACVTERNEAAGDAIRQASCADLGETPGETPGDPVVGPACTKIKATCPSV